MARCILKKHYHMSDSETEYLSWDMIQMYMDGIVMMENPDEYKKRKQEERVSNSVSPLEKMYMRSALYKSGVSFEQAKKQKLIKVRS